jgi:exopolysaccharide biosynthesis protein
MLLERKIKMKKNKTVKKKVSYKLVILFLIFELIFTGCTAPYIVYYGPFQNLKRTIVGMANSTMNHKYIATLFLSKEKIDEILKQPVGVAPATDIENAGDIKIKASHDQGIERYNIEGKKFNGYMLVIKDPSRVKVGYTKKLGIEGERTSQMAKDNNAVAAINGGGFTDKSSGGKLWAGTGSIPTGIVMADGKIVAGQEYSDSNDKVEAMGLTNKGVLVVGSHSLKELIKMGVTEIISFGPTLIINGKSQIQGDGGQGANPRTAIGQRANGDILMLVIDGRKILTKPGATLREVQELMLQYGAVNAVNLDGGSSSTMYYNDEIVNDPCDPLGERSIASCLYVRP